MSLAAIDTFERTDLIDDAARAAFERSGVNRQNREEELATVKTTLKDTEDSIERYLAAFEARTMPEAPCGERIRTLGVRVVELRERRDDLVPRQATFARNEMARRASSSLWRFRQAM